MPRILNENCTFMNLASEHSSFWNPPPPFLRSLLPSILFTFRMSKLYLETISPSQGKNVLSNSGPNSRNKNTTKMINIFPTCRRRQLGGEEDCWWHRVWHTTIKFPLVEWKGSYHHLPPLPPPDSFAGSLLCVRRALLSKRRLLDEHRKWKFSFFWRHSNFWWKHSLRYDE